MSGEKAKLYGLAAAGWVPSFHRAWPGTNPLPVPPAGCALRPRQRSRSLPRSAKEAETSLKLQTAGHLVHTPASWVHAKGSHTHTCRALWDTHHHPKTLRHFNSTRSASAYTQNRRHWHCVFKKQLLKLAISNYEHFLLAGMSHRASPVLETTQLRAWFQKQAWEKPSPCSGARSYQSFAGLFNHPVHHLTGSDAGPPPPPPPELRTASLNWSLWS